MAQQVDERVEVQARTNRGRLVPILVTWKGKSYTISRVEKTRRQRIKGKKLDTMLVQVMAPRLMQLELDHHRQAWRLVTIGEAA